ncbi:Pectate lyase [Gossypium arboreum]|uniref:Pectate lyase n=1 Tax=Gossypium arboreum TaxID=29729 RepID=A0A0B0ND20_GOSAR|nr:pectate lyase-like isoform X3 [Gossypium arboreum]KHG08946.1 Pectate lyase [Gossypium arboreum]
MEITKLRLVFLFAFFTAIPRLWANIVEFDDFWKQREEEAWKLALASYEPNPENVTNHLNYKVNKENWAENRKRLALCGLGFGRKATGGDEGNYYLVTDNSDDDVLNPKPGTLRYAVIQNKPLWIIFAKDMHIKLSKELIVQSNKTIDGRGANVHIAHGCGITLQFVHNVIIHNVHIHHIIESRGGLIRDSEDHYGYRTVGDGDGISIFGSSNIWLDHISMSECQDGLIDVIQGSTAITISNCHFTHHDHVILLGGSDTYSNDQYMQVTIAFNHFGKELIQRMPRCRWGFFHVVNNDYTHWKMYAIGGSTHPTIISEGNRYIAPDDPNTKEITNRNYAPESEWKNWVWRSEGDLYMNGAFFRTSGPPSPPNLSFSEKDVIKAKPATFVRRLTRFAGTLNCKQYVKC